MDAIELLKSDHRKVEDLFARYEGAPSPADKRGIVDEMIRELSIHSAIEEQLVYPLIRMRVEGGGDVANHSIEEHAAVKRLLADIEKLDTTSEDYYTKVNAVIADVKKHVGEEETSVFPRLEAKVSAEQREKLGMLMEKAKSLVPTHPHPMVPGTATAQLLAGPWASIADHIRDFVDGMKKAS